jgi:hypothetical protein
MAQTTTAGVRAPVFRAGSMTAWSATLAITAPVGSGRAQILRGGRLIDQFPASPGSALAYTDYLLWPATTYSYEIRWLSPAGSIVLDQRLSLRTTPANGAFPRMYGPASFWNQPIVGGAALDPNSAAIVARSLAGAVGESNLANSDAWGIAVAYANPASRRYSVGCRLYGCDRPASFRIPSYAAPTTGSDHHLVVLDPGAGTELDTWEATYDATTDSWSAGSRYITAMAGWGALCQPGQRCGGAVAAGFAALGGIIRPEEIAQGHIDHALFLTLPNVRSNFVACPATGSDGGDSNPAAIPEGARVQLDPGFNVNAQPWPLWEKVVARALQQYGGYVGDTGDTLAIRAEATIDRGYNAWALVGVPSSPSLAALPWGDFRVQQIQPC